MKNFGWDWLRCREAKDAVTKDIMLTSVLINKIGQGLCSGARATGISQLMSMHLNSLTLIIRLRSALD